MDEGALGMAKGRIWGAGIASLGGALAEDVSTDETWNLYARYLDLRLNCMACHVLICELSPRAATAKL